MTIRMKRVTGSLNVDTSYILFKSRRRGLSSTLLYLHISYLTGSPPFGRFGQILATHRHISGDYVWILNLNWYSNVDSTAWMNFHGSFFVYWPYILPFIYTGFCLLSPGENTRAVVAFTQPTWVTEPLKTFIKWINLVLRRSKNGIYSC